MTNKIFRSIFGVALGLIFIVTMLVLGLMYNYFSMEQENEMRSEAAYVAAGIEDNGLAYLEKIEKPIDRITWIDGEGQVLFDTRVQPEKMDNHKEREEVQQAMETGEGFSQRFSKTLSEKTVNYAVKLTDGTILRISTSTLSPLTLFFTLTQPLVWIIVLAIGLSLFLAFQTAKKLTKPINDIDLEQPEQAVVYDELTPLLRRIAVQNRQIEVQMRDLMRQKQEFDTITSNMQEGLLVLDGDGDVLSYNEGALNLMGINEPKKGANVFALNRSEGFRLCVEAALGGQHRQESIQMGGKVCQLLANPVIQEETIQGAILVLFDVTEKEEREKLRREFTANVSHELKTPLTSISGFAEIMKNGMVLTEDMPKFAGKIYDEAQRLIQLVQDIIKLSKLDEEQVTMEKVHVDITKLVLDVAERLRPIANKQEITIETQVESVSVFGVEQVIQEMVYNLCDNALRYNHTNGKVFISLKALPKEVVFTVEDTGMGIAQSNQKRVFERFYRVNPSRSKETEGTGLGLSIVKHGAMLHNAKIELESKLEKGTRITLRFPIR